MAIISIPTSIGGVSIPGAAINGPLGPLYQNKFGRTDLQYPRDLQSATRGHMVHFKITDIKPREFEELKSYFLKGVEGARNLATDGIVKAKEFFSGSAEEIKDKSIDEAKRFGAAIGEFGEKFWTGEFTKQIASSISNPKSDSSKSIALYMPDTLNFTYAVGYGQTDLLTAASSLPLIAGRAASAVTQTLNNPAARLALRGLGYALNPNQQVLFDGIDFRTYQLAFTFTPYSRQEAATVKEIIKMFRTHAAPRLLSGAGGGMFFIPPSIFKPTFMFNGAINKNINQVAESVITNIVVDYAPQGFSSHSDGAPVQTTLTIDFRELELITREKIQQGY